jgi:signal peptidase II
MSDSSAPVSETATPEPGRRRAVVAASVAALAFLILDLATKAWAWNTLREGPRLTVIKQWFYFDFSFNTGSAFGFLRGHDFSRPLFIVITLATVVYMAMLVRKLPTQRLYGFIAIGCIIGGALGNLHDRLLRQIARQGRADPRRRRLHPDLLHAQGRMSWPNFNIADVALVIGVALLIPFLIWHADPSARPRGA